MTKLNIFVLIISLLIGCQNLQRADLVLLNGNVVTVDESNPRAQAIAISGDKIIAAGSNELIRKYAGQKTRRIDLQGKLVIPGFIDSHAHFLSLGQFLMKVNLREGSDWPQIVTIVRDEAQKKHHGEWIIGRGWHQDKWSEPPKIMIDGFPVHTILSAAVPDHPVSLRHASGHALIVNKKALHIVGIDRHTPDPPGGRIIRFPDGQPTGLLLENAQDIVLDYLKEMETIEDRQNKNARKLEAIRLATKECLSNGITSFHDAGSSFDTIELFKKLAAEGKLGLRLWVMLSESNENLSKRIDKYRIINGYNNFLTVRAIKQYMDGALGARGAWLLEPYTDMPSTSGLQLTPLDSLKVTARIAIEHDFQLGIHAIGDRANREVLDLYEDVFKQYPNKKNLRWRIEHAQHLHPDDIARFAKLGVTAAMQGIHCVSDGSWVPDRLGTERAKSGAYPWRSLIHSGTVIANGTDAPVEDVDPFANFHALVTRKLADGSLFFPDQVMSREEALRAYTINAAYAGFNEKIKGSITPGKLADIVVLSKDIMTIPEDEIINTKVIYTIIGGEILYQNSK